MTEDDVLSPEEMAALPRSFVHISRRRFVLEYYRRTNPESTDLRLMRRFRCATGALGFTTPHGPFLVKAKARHPSWLMPDSWWVPEEKRGTLVPGTDPDNPIKEAFIKLTDDGIGIHGTDNMLSLGSRASHGCIRVAPATAIYLYNRVMPGDPVWIT